MDIDNNEPKYKQIKDYMISHIQSRNLSYNDPISSEAELMKHFNVSRHTVRKAIGDLVNEGWLYKQQGKGTFVANTVAKKPGAGKLIGVITTYIHDYIFPDIISGIESVLSENGYSIILGNTNNNTDKERAILQNMLNNNLAGLIIEPTKSVYPNHNKDLFDEFNARGIPILFIHATYQNVSASYIVEDDQKAGYLVTKHLIAKGHKQIGGVFKQDDLQGHGRYAGYLQAHREAGVDIVDERVLWYTTESFTDMNRLYDLSGQISALVCYNDQIAISIISELEKIGRKVPQSMSVVSFDNSNMAETTEVKLTTIAHPKEKLGVKAAQSILQLINNQVKVIHEVMEPELIIRNSVRKKQ